MDPIGSLIGEPLKRETIASALFGGVSLFVLFVAFTNFGPRSPHAALFVLAFCCQGLSLAFAPEILFSPVTLKSLFKGDGQFMHGIAAILFVLSDLFFIGGTIFFWLS
jgi:hypothetical protein